MNIKYLCIFSLTKDTDFGLRHQHGYYHLDLIVQKGGEKIAIEKYKVNDSEYKELIENDELKVNDKYLLIIKDIISQFLLNVKSESVS